MDPTTDVLALIDDLKDYVEADGSTVTVTETEIEEEEDADNDLQDVRN